RWCARSPRMPPSSVDTGSPSSPPSFATSPLASSHSPEPYHLPMPPFAQRLSNWRYVMSHPSLPDGVEMDSVSKWMIVTRAGVFTMTAPSGLIGGLLAIATPDAAVNYWYLALAVIGLVVAHAANNMINDYFDLEAGID